MTNCTCDTFTSSGATTTLAVSNSGTGKALVVSQITSDATTMEINSASNNYYGISVVHTGTNGIAIKATTSGAVCAIHGTCSGAGGNGVYGANTSTSGNGVYGVVTGSGSTGSGIYGSTAGILYGVFGTTTGYGSGVCGHTNNTGNGVYGLTPNTGNGVYGDNTNATSGNGVLGTAQSGGNGVKGTNTGSGSGVYGSTTGTGSGVYGITTSTGSGVYGIVTSTASSGKGVYGLSQATTGTGVWGDATTGTGVRGSGGGSGGIGVYGDTSNSTGIGVKGVASSASGGYGVYADGSAGGYGVYSTGLSYGVYAVSTGSSSKAIYATSPATAIYGYSSNAISTGAGITGECLSGSRAGLFIGNVYVNGTLSKNAGTFTIDHPMDPENKILNHSFVESPEMMNLYSGTVEVGNSGTEEVELPEYFESLNMTFRYHLTSVGGASPNLHVSKEVDGNKFEVSGGTPGTKVCWTVSGVRKDAYALANPISVVVDKTEDEKGKFLNPELFGKGRSHKIGVSHNE